jgi:hypothetical protein
MSWSALAWSSVCSTQLFATKIQFTAAKFVPCTAFYAEDRVKFGNETIFNILIEETNNLRTKGIEVCVEGKKYQLIFVMVQLLGDNLGLNSILGYVECFSANYYCRACKMHKQQMISACSERSDLLRTAHNYSED